MAEFLDVMRQAQKICDTYKCDDCPMVDHVDMCGLIHSKYRKAGFLLEFEQIVMQWAKEHPELQYPTWKEWKKANFPDASIGLTPCSFMSRERQGKIMGEECVFLDCADCINTPIPADIAKKLGIRPKEA